jgi:hypothetical protein
MKPLTPLQEQLFDQMCDVIDAVAGKAQGRDVLPVMAIVAAEVLKQEELHLQEGTLQIFLEDIKARVSQLKSAN